MKVRLRKEVEGLEVGKVYDIRITETFDRDALECWIDGNMYKVYDNLLEDFLEDFEVLQPVSDTTKQAVAETLHRLSIVIAHDLQVEDITWDEMQHVIEDHLNNHYVRSVLEGEQ